MNRIKMSKIGQGLAAGALALSLTACGASSLLALPAVNLQNDSAQAATAQATVIPGALATQAPVQTNMDQLLEDLYTRTNPSVVNITVVVSGANGQTNNPDPLSPTPQAPGSGLGLAQGSGFVYDAQGHIVTNNHVVDGATKITVIFADGVEAAATVVGTAPAADLAVIKVDVDAGELHPLPLGSSDALKVGQSVVAIGNPFGLAGSMSTGIVSGLGRLLADGGATANGQSYSIPDIVQTDAAINPGNSGGPLLDLAGNVVGVNTAIESAVRSNSGVGYAVPADLVACVVPSLISTGKFEVSYMGISGGTLGADLAKAMGLDPQQRGVLVAEVTTGGPAAKAGLLGSTKDTTIDGLPAQIGGDVIVAVDGKEVKQFDDLLSYLVRHTSAGDQVTLSILRDGKPMDIKVTLGVRPAA
jgi:serine protease Do